jgi:hypothetical protein
MTDFCNKSVVDKHSEPIHQKLPHVSHLEKWVCHKISKSHLPKTELKFYIFQIEYNLNVFELK